MSVKSMSCLVLLALLLASATIALGDQDPELKTCKHQCRAQQQFDKEKIRICEQQCEEYIRQKERRERGGDAELNRESPIERLRECSKRCQQQQQGERVEDCQRRCQEEYQREKQRYEGGGSDNPREPEECRRRCRQQHEGRRYQEECEKRCQEKRGEEHNEEIERDPQRYKECRQRCRQEHEGRRYQEECEKRCQEQRREGHNGERESEEEEEEQWQHQGKEEKNPYVFEDRHFFTGMQTEHGRLRILQNFAERSRLLLGIANFRLAILEAEPQTFVVPHHCDAETVAFVAKGRGTVSLIRRDRTENFKRESFNIREGDIFRIRAGVTTYFINRDTNERLVIAKLIQPVNTPGEFVTFFGAGGEDPESFYRAFSNEVLEAAFNTRRDKLKRLFGQQKQGAILKASREQIRAMSHHEEGGIWPFGGESKGTHNLYEQRPTHSNEYGQLYEVDSSEFRQLRDLDIAISLANITQGAMTAPYYTSKATKISVVVDGEGYFEMACPHLSESQGRQQGRHQGREHGTRGGRVSYQTVRSRLRRGTVVVIPAGHPFVAVASNNQNLQLLCFETNADENQRITLAGRKNVINHLEREAKELAFGMPAREVDEVFRSQEEEFFFPGPRQHEEGRSDE